MNAFEKIHSKEFAKWAEGKLQRYAEFRDSGDATTIKVDFEKPFNDDQKNSIRSNIASSNICFFSIENTDAFQNGKITKFAGLLGLFESDANLCANEDRLSRITVSDASPNKNTAGRYIPYTDKALGWHTDGYYNPFNQRIRSFLLACETPAESGGDNSFIDPEIIYILLYQQNPRYVQVLTDPLVMTIPENKVNGVVLRPETQTSVFQFSENTIPDDTEEIIGLLDMRYSQRKTFIRWKDDVLVEDAIQCLDHLLDTNNSEFNWLKINRKLKAGEMVVCNNVLHKRTAFKDNENSPRVLHRARFYQPVSIR